MRLVYLDEAGTSRNEPAMCVAGVLVHGDYQSFELTKMLDQVRQRHIPEADRETVIFHATDIFHGSRYFDRRRWTQEKRLQILTDLAAVIENLNLSIVSGQYQKDKYGQGIDWSAVPQELKKTIMHTGAAMDCALWTDRWLAKYAPTENALITAEDNDYVKRMMKESVRILRSQPLMDQRGLNELGELGLPLKRIVDTPHFASKRDCPPLQLADLCAFVIGRVMKDKPVPTNVATIIANHLKWTRTYDLNTASTA